MHIAIIPILEKHTTISVKPALSRLKLTHKSMAMLMCAGAQGRLGSTKREPGDLPGHSSAPLLAPESACSPSIYKPRTLFSTISYPSRVPPSHRKDTSKATVTATTLPYGNF